MKKLAISLLVLILGVGAVAYAMGELKEPETYSWRYKMTVEIDTPEGVKSGYAVREVTVLLSPSSSAKSGYYASKSMKGEAVIVDLGERGTVFSTQSTDDYALPFRVFKSSSPSLTREGAKYYSSLSAKGDLPKTNYPMMIMFTDIKDPLSVKLIYGTRSNEKGETPPYTFQDNFEEYLGTDVRLKNISIEMTDEDVTFKVKKLLPWLKEYKNKLLDGNTIHTIDAENRLANRLGAGSFSTDMEDK